MKGRLGFSAIKGNKERLPKKKIYCQNRKMVCHYLQLEDSEVQELLFLLIRHLFFFFFLNCRLLLACFRHTASVSVQQEKCTTVYSLFTGQGFLCHLLFTSQLAAVIPGRPQKSPVLLSGKRREYDFPIREVRELESQTVPPPCAQTLCLTAALSEKGQHLDK